MDIEQYPYLIDRDGAIPYPDSPDETMETQVMTGWRPLFQQMCDKINAILDNYGVPRDCFHFDQVKEKFGALRIYWHVEYPDSMPGPECDAPQDELCDVIDAAEFQSSGICCFCGKIAKWHSTGWVLPYCDDCAQQKNKEANERHKTNFTVGQTFSQIQFDD